jgi:hypothetical protein
MMEQYACMYVIAGSVLPKTERLIFKLATPQQLTIHNSVPEVWV